MPRLNNYNQSITEQNKNKIHHLLTSMEIEFDIMIVSINMMPFKIHKLDNVYGINLSKVAHFLYGQGIINQKPNIIRNYIKDLKLYHTVYHKSKDYLIVSNT